MVKVGVGGLDSLIRMLTASESPLPVAEAAAAANGAAAADGCVFILMSLSLFAAGA